MCDTIGDMNPSDNTCEGCPLVDLEVCSGIWEGNIDDMDEVERRVDKWVEEHPQPEYPTWLEWLVDMGVVPKEISMREADVARSIGLLEPIPVYIAEKLGV